MAKHFGISLLATTVILAACGDTDQTAQEQENATTTPYEATQIVPAPLTRQKPTSFLDRLPEDEVVYFVLPDRFENADTSNDKGGLTGGPLDHGFDPTHKGFYNGGDLKGFTARLDYIQGLGATAIWLGPIYKNKPVQGAPGQESSGYHGYWITDFTDVDPHLGTKADLKEFIDATHARGIKVYLDIITNHTADIIQFKECHSDNEADIAPENKAAGRCLYRPKAAYPFTTVGDPSGEPINQEFMGDTRPYQTTVNFAKLTRHDFAYTPVVPEAEKNVKVPAWLNDVKYYHNRGDTTFEGESSQYGDFVGLDDLATENPFVVDGFIDIYKDWITEFRVDGFRVDTARHVNPEFWQRFIPEIIAHAKAEGIPNFYVFGEVALWDAANLAVFTHTDGYPTVLDFPLQGAIEAVVGRGGDVDILAKRFASDIIFKGGYDTAKQLPTFIGNHDHGRFAHHMLKARPDMSEEEATARVKLAHAVLMFSRGVPVIYYGDEQGFTGDGNDQAARENMFPSQVASFNDNNLLGTDETTAISNFNTDHPIYLAIAEMSKVYRKHDTLRRGDQKTRYAEKGEGVFAITKTMEGTAEEYLVVFNNNNEEVTKHIEVNVHSLNWSSVHGNCEARVAARGSYKVTLAPLDFVICRSEGAS